MKKISVILLAASLSGTALGQASRESGVEPIRWAVYYSDDVALTEFDPFDLLVLDSDYHPPLRALSDRGKTLFGYVSIGEVGRGRSYYDAVREQGLTLGENPNWEGSLFVDVRSGAWTKRVIEEIIPRLLRKGFDGVFLDTVDNAAYLEDRFPERYAGMTGAMSRLILTIREHYPSVPIIMNRGLDVLPRVEHAVEYVLAESLYTDFDFDRQTYSRVDPDMYRRQVAALKAAEERQEDLTILSLDYWDPDDAATIDEIYRVERRSGFHPYVATLALDRIVPPPK